jgi:hypothetical protein
VVSETSLISYTLRYFSLTELDTLFQFGLRVPIYLCVYVSEEGGDGQGVVSEVTSLIFIFLKNKKKLGFFSKINILSVYY